MLLQSQRTRVFPVLLVLCGAPFLATLDLFVVNVAFAEIGRSFPGHSLADTSWVLGGYAIVYAALLVPAGRYADRIGHLKVFQIGLVVFSVASLAAAASPGLWELVAFRVLQAAGAAAVTPSSLGLLLHVTAPERRAGAVRIWATSGAVAAALGPLVGGLLVEISWRWVFLVNLPFGAILILLAARILPEETRDTDPAPPDLAGAALLFVAVAAAAAVLVRGPEWGWLGLESLATLLLALVALAWFAGHILRHPAPLLDRDLLRVPRLAWANVVTVVFNASFAAGLLALILFLQEVWGYGALRTGLAVAPGPLVVPAFAFAGQLLARRIPAGWIAAAGNLLWAAGTALIWLSAGPEASYTTAVLPGWLVCGVGVGLALPTILAAATAGLPSARTATGSAVANMSRQLGIVLGVALLVAVFGRPQGAGAVLDAFENSWLLVAGIAVLAAMVSPRLSSRDARA